MNEDEIWLPEVRHDLTLGEAFAQRRSSRDFSAAELGPADLAGVLAGARRDETGWVYPSAHDRRPVGVTVLVRASRAVSRRAFAYDPADHCLRLQGRTLEHHLSSIAHDEQPWVDSAPVVLALHADIAPVAAEFEDQDPSGLRGRDFVMVEAGALAQALLLGAAAAGVAAVLVAGVKQDACRDLLRTSRHVCSLIALGRPATG